VVLPVNAWPPSGRFSISGVVKGCPLSSLSPHKKANDPCQPRSLDKEILGKSRLVELTNGRPLRITEDGRKVLADHAKFIEILESFLQFPAIHGAQCGPAAIRDFFALLDVFKATMGLFVVSF
jgi:hypothetical protein